MFYKCVETARVLKEIKLDGKLIQAGHPDFDRPTGGKGCGSTNWYSGDKCFSIVCSVAKHPTPNATWEGTIEDAKVRWADLPKEAIACFEACASGKDIGL